MNEAIKELKVVTVSKCTEDGAAYIAVLKEKDGERILPVLIERSEAYLLLMKMKGNKKNALPSSMSDIMRAAFMQCNMSIEEVRIATVEGGRNLLSRPLPARKRFSHDSLLQGVRLPDSGLYVRLPDYHRRGVAGAPVYARSRRRNVFHPGKFGERGCIERGVEKGCGRREL